MTIVATSDTTTATDLAMPPVGPPPDLDETLIGALIYGGNRDVLALVADGDLAAPTAATVLGVIRDMTSEGRTICPQLVLDELTRRGADPSTHRVLAIATTSGAAPGAAREYATAVVAAAWRRGIESFGHALQQAANSAAEPDLACILADGLTGCANTAARLSELRGGVA